MKKPIMRCLNFALLLVVGLPMGANAAQSWQRIVLTEYGDSDVLTLETVQGLPPPGPDEVRIRVEAASASFTDVLVRKGLYGEVDEEPPLVPGYDLVGVIEAVGEGVEPALLGQRVADLSVWGAYTEYAIRPAKHLVPVPPDVDANEAVGLILSYTTAYQMLHRVASMTTGDTILVHGASGAVGSALTELANLEDIRVFGTASSAKHDYVRQRGALPIDYRSEDFVSVIAQQTDNKGVDAAFDAISLDNFKRSYEALGDNGALVTYGLYSASLAAGAGNIWSVASEFLAFQWQQFLWDWFPSEERSVTFYSITAMRAAHPDWFREDLSELMSLLADRKVSPRIWQVLPLSRASEAHELIESGVVEGKVVLVPDALLLR